MRTHSFAVADARMNNLETTVGTAPVMRTYNGTPPANVRAALSGNTVIGQGSLPSDWLAASASGVLAKAAGAWSITGQAGAGAGSAATFYRIFDSTGATAHEQGTFGAAVAINTSAATPANGNVLTFAATTGVAVGQKVSGTGVVAETTVVAFTATTVTLSQTSTAGVASAAAITFGYDMTVDNNNLANTQTMTITSYTATYGNL